MRSILMGMMVLWIPVPATAGMLDLVITGKGNSPSTMQAVSPVKEITVNAGNYIWIDIVYTGEIDKSLWSVGAMVDIQGPGSWIESSLSYPAETWDLSHFHSIDFQTTSVEISVCAGLDYYGIPGTGAPVAAVSHILYRHEGIGVSSVGILPSANYQSVEMNQDGDAFIDMTYGTGVIITEVPEPATLSLILLGGLAAMRRKRN